MGFGRRIWGAVQGGWSSGTPRARATAIGLAVVLLFGYLGGPLLIHEAAKPWPLTPAVAAEGCGAAVIDPPEGRSLGQWHPLRLPEHRECFELMPVTSDAGGVAPDTDFVFRAASPMEATVLARRLRIDPAVRFRVEPIAGDAAASEGAEGSGDIAAAGGARYRVDPAGSLARGAVYRFSLEGERGGPPVRRWAFQVQAPLRVVQTFPADRSTDVPPAVGIELTFSHDGVTGVEERFAIAPRVEGRFETHRRVVVFVPKKLASRTVYTVTLRRGVRAAGTSRAVEKDLRFQFETGDREDGDEEFDRSSLAFTKAVWESPTARAPALGLFDGEERKRRPTLRFVVYRFSGAGAFVGALDRMSAGPAWTEYAKELVSIDTAGLPRAASFSARLQRLGSEGDLFVQFPEALPPGYYLVRTTFENYPLQALLQVTDVATYAAVSKRRTLVWANDLAAAEPLAGVRVTLAGAKALASTDGDGVASFATPPGMLRLEPDELGETTGSAVGNLVVTARDGRTAVVPLSDVFRGFTSFDYREYTFPGDPTLYWRFLHTDRKLYRPTDTVRFWGLVRAREKPRQALPLTVEILDDSVYDEDGRPVEAVTLARTDVKTSKRGTFIGSLDLRMVSPGSYTVRALTGDQVVASTAIDVQDFVKPAYALDVRPRRAALFAGETAIFDVRASFFEGTPVPGMKLRYSVDYDDKSRSTQTDAAGRAVVRARARKDDEEFMTFDVHPARVEEGEITGSAEVRVFPSALTLDADARVRSGRGAVRGRVFTVDIDKVNASDAPAEVDERGAPAPGRTVRATVVEVSYRRIEAGYEYDFVAKRVRPLYRYERVERDVGSFSDRSDERGRFSIAFDARPRRSYDVTVRVTDDAGRTYEEETFADEGYPSSDDYSVTRPYLAAVSPGPFAIGDDVALEMRSGLNAMPKGGTNRYLFYQARDGIREHLVAAAPRYRFRFREEHAPTTEVLGVRFTGTTYQEIAYGFTATFDTRARELRLTVAPDRARYRPGQTATLEARVTDRDGRPVSGAEVLLGAVDEALYRLQGQMFYDDLDILETLYERVSSGLLQAYASHQHPAVEYGGEHGGEGPAREDFRDVALFDRVRTGADGTATVRFHLPDNLTSWRVRALAVTGDLHAGSATALVPVGLPLFVDVAMNNTYLVRDHPAIRLRAFGETLRSGEAVTFTVGSKTLLDEPVRARGTAFEPVDVPLPPLREGRHRLTVRVRAGGRSDAITRTIAVVPSRLLRTEVSFTEVPAGQRASIQGSPDRLTRVVVSDRNRGRYYPVLASLAAGEGDRGDQRLARDLAHALLARHFDERGVRDSFEAGRYQTPDGGIAIYPYADDDLVLSARVAALAPERFDRRALRRYLQGVFEDSDETRERVVVAMSGLAALGVPLLPDAQAVAARTDLTPVEQVYAGLAAVALGDEDTGRRLYRRLLAEFGEYRGDMLRLAVKSTREDRLEVTALAATLGAALGDDLAPLLFAYTVRERSHESVLALEQIAYLDAALPRLAPEAVRVAFTHLGTRTERRLERRASIALTLTPERLRALDLRVLEGVAGVATSYEASFDPARLSSDSGITIERVYGDRTRGPVTLRDGDLVRITLDYGLGSDPDPGCYQVTDLLPSGLRAVSAPYTWGIQETEEEDEDLALDVDYPYAIEGQRVSFCVSRGDRDSTVSYYARVIGTGISIAEPATIQSQQTPGSIAVTPPVEVRIQ